MDERLQAIKERLAAATPGPWREGDGIWSDSANVLVVTDAEGPDTTFIANAPSDIAYLLSLLDLADKARSVEHRVNW